MPDPKSAIVRYKKILHFVVIPLAIVFSIFTVLDAISWIDRPFPGFLFMENAVVSPMGQFGWPGIQAGLAIDDKIISVEGQTILTAHDVYEIIRIHEPGDLIEYELERRGESFSITIPVSHFTFNDFLVVFLIPFLLGVMFLVFGITVFSLRPEVPASWPTLLMSTLFGFLLFLPLISPPATDSLEFST